MDINGLVQNMIENERFQQLVNNPLAQLGTPARPYLGATILPEREVPENSYTEEDILYRTNVANHGTRYSPVQIKEGVLMGAFDVKLSNSDIGSEFKGAEYDALVRLMDRYTGPNMNKPSPQMVMSMMGWGDKTLAMPLQEVNEKMRWECINDASVPLRGDNNYTDTALYSNPTGTRVSAGGTWSSDSYDPYPDIIHGMEFLATKGYAVNRMFAGQTVRGILSMNEFIRTRVGRLSMAGGTTVGLSGRASLSRINAMFSEDGLPELEIYDLQYRTSTGTSFFFRRDALTMVATTGRDQSIDLGDADPYYLINTLGYLAVGRAAGQASPGRKVVVTPYENKPPRVEGEAWQTTLPVDLEPEAVYVISSIA